MPLIHLLSLFLHGNNVTVEILSAQARRISCEKCLERFNFVFGQRFESKGRGTPFLSNNDGLHRLAIHQAWKKLRQRARNRKLGIAHCPHCKELQGWMVRSTYFHKIGRLLLIGALALPFVAGMVAGNVKATEDHILPIMGAVALLGALGSVALGRHFAHKALAAHGEHDPRAMSDHDFLAFVDKMKGSNADVALSWYFMIGHKQPEPKVLQLSLGFDDTVGGLPFPSDQTTAAILERQARSA